MTMWWFRADSSNNIFATSDVRLIFILSSTLDNTWRSKFEKETNSILPACWSYGSKSQRSRCNWYEYTASCTMHGKTSRRSILGRHPSCYWERIDILSDSIERHHSSRNTPNSLYPESFSDGNWKSHFRESVHVTSASAKDLIEARMEEKIGFRTCSTTRSRTAI